jgi:hypothetical protein
METASISGQEQRVKAQEPALDVQNDLIGDNMVLSNRDKTEHSRDRGQDSKWTQTEQLKDHAANKGRG